MIKQYQKCQNTKNTYLLFIQNIQEKPIFILNLGILVYILKFIYYIIFIFNFKKIKIYMKFKILRIS